MEGLMVLGGVIIFIIIVCLTSQQTQRRIARLEHENFDLQKRVDTVYDLLIKGR